MTKHIMFYLYHTNSVNNVRKKRLENVWFVVYGHTSLAQCLYRMYCQCESVIALVQCNINNITRHYYTPVTSFLLFFNKELLIFLSLIDFQVTEQHSILF